MVVTARSCAAYCNGALNRIDSFVCPTEPPCAEELVVIVTFVNPSIEPDREKELAPFASIVFVTIYSKITMLPSANDWPIVPSPK